MRILSVILLVGFLSCKSSKTEIRDMEVSQILVESKSELNPKKFFDLYDHIELLDSKLSSKSQSLYLCTIRHELGAKTMVLRELNKHEKIKMAYPVNKSHRSSSSTNSKMGKSKPGSKDN